MRDARRYPAGLLATAGVATSETVHITLAAAGLSAFFAAAPTAFTALHLTGAVYLMYLGVQTIRHRGYEPVESAGAGGVSGRRAYLRGLLTNLVNPKMVLFAIRTRTTPRSCPSVVRCGRILLRPSR